MRARDADSQETSHKVVIKMTSAAASEELGTTLNFFAAAHPEELTVTINHPTATVSWDEDLWLATPSTEDESLEPSLPAGSCSMYTFPTVTTRSFRAAIEPCEAGVLLLRHLLYYLTILDREAAKGLGSAPFVFDVPDREGAYPVHALMIRNSTPSLAIVMELFTLDPRLLTHLHHESGIFAGESSLHIAAANQQEQAFLQILQLALETLPPDELTGLLLADTVGVFFEQHPMRTFGGTALSYAACHGMKDAVRALLQTGIVSLVKNPSTTSGFYPIHAVIANRRLDMYDFLTDGSLPASSRLPQLITQVSRLNSNAYLYNLTPLGLATRIGDRRSVRHILRKQCAVDWVWGSVTQITLDLSGIDSVHEGDQNIMDLIVRSDSSQRTKELLLDNFMNGFIFDLFREKWSRFGRKVHLISTGIDVVIFVLIVVSIISFKIEPTMMRTKLQPVNISAFILIALAIAWQVQITISMFVSQLSVQRPMFDVAGSPTRWSRVRRAHRATHAWKTRHSKSSAKSVQDNLYGMAQQATLSHLPIREVFREMHRFNRQHSLYRQLFAYVVSLTSVLVQLRFAASMMEAEQFGEGAYNVSNVSNARQLAKARSTSGDTSGTSELDFVSLENIEIRNERTMGWLYIINACVIFVLGLHVCMRVFVQFEPLYILMRTSGTMLSRDVATFMSAYIVFIFFTILGLFTLYPRSGDNKLPHAIQFNEFPTSVRAVFDLAFLGTSLDFSLSYMLSAFEDGLLSFSQVACLLCWIILYYATVIVMVILMVNLLIAMLSTTYDDVRKQSLLFSRHAFATHISYLEKIASTGLLGFLNLDLHVGEKMADGRHVHKFRAFNQKQGDDGAGGDDIWAEEFQKVSGSDPFMDPTAGGMSRELVSMRAMQLDMLDQHEEVMQALTAARHALAGASSSGENVGGADAEQQKATRSQRRAAFNAEYGGMGNAGAKQAARGIAGMFGSAKNTPQQQLKKQLQRSNTSKAKEITESLSSALSPRLSKAASPRKAAVSEVSLPVAWEDK